MMEHQSGTISTDADPANVSDRAPKCAIVRGVVTESSEAYELSNVVETALARAGFGGGGEPVGRGHAGCRRAAAEATGHPASAASSEPGDIDRPSTYDLNMRERTEGRMLTKGDPSGPGAGTLFRADRVAVLDVSAHVIDRATNLRARHGFKTPDAIHLATAVESTATEFWTGDAALSRCTDIAVRALLPAAP